MKGSIICIGNRFVEEDAAGILVFDKLHEILPPTKTVNIIEGGLAGLNLLPHLEEGGRVVFVDAVAGFAKQGEIALLHRKDIVSNLSDAHFDHGTGLAYVLTVLPWVCDGKLPEELILVGLEGICSPQMIERAARLSMTIATHGLRDH